MQVAGKGLVSSGFLVRITKTSPQIGAAGVVLLVDAILEKPLRKAFQNKKNLFSMQIIHLN